MLARLRVVVIAVSTVVVGVVVACTDKQAQCRVDADCPPGSYCRDAQCASIATADAGVPDALVPTPVCASPGASCTIDSECCTPPCTALVCGGALGSSGTPGTSGSSGTSGGTPGTSGSSGTSGTTSSGGTCSDLYGLCSGDFECCAGLSCVTGTCS